MQRIIAWWKARQEARVSSDQSVIARRGAQTLTVLVIGCILFLVVWLLLFSGRWAYRAVFHHKKVTAPVKVQTEPNQKESSGTKTTPTTPTTPPPASDKNRPADIPAPVPEPTPPATDQLPRSGPAPE